VRDVMTREVVTLKRNDKLTTAEDVMRLGRIRHMPVIDEDGQLCGIVSQRDLFHSALLKAMGYGTHAAQKLRDMYLVKETMTSEVATVSPDTPLAEAAARMLEHKIGSLVVVDDDGTMVGILTEADFVKLKTKR
jgi:CBS domain-containing protein